MDQKTLSPEEAEKIFNITYRKDGTCVIDRYIGTETEVTVPAQIGNAKVTAIGIMAFFERSEITDILLPEGITEIRGQAFAGCSGLTEIHLPKCLTHVGDEILSRCTGLTDIVLPDRLTILGWSMFSRCVNLKSISIPPSVTIVKALVFADCKNLTNVVFPESLTEIGWGVFSGCASLKSVILPSCMPNRSESGIWERTFAGCASLESFVIPDGAPQIAWGAFLGCSSLTSITIPHSVKQIGDHAFDGCRALQSITVPYTTKKIGDHAFDGCENSVIYALENSAAAQYLKKRNDPFEEIPFAKITAINHEAAHYFRQALYSPEGNAGLEYCYQRGFTDETIKRFILGYAPEDHPQGLLRVLKEKGYWDAEMILAHCPNLGFRNRLMIPIANLQGRIASFCGKALDETKPTFLNSPDQPDFREKDNLFALDLALASKKDGLILCDGYFDTIALHQAGFPNTIAILGEKLTEEQTLLIARCTDEVILAFNPDQEGQKKAEQTADILKKHHVRCRPMPLLNGKDPHGSLNRYGTVAFRSLTEENI